MGRRYRVLVLVVAAAIMVTSLPANACSCATGDARDQLEDADGAIIGTVLAKTGYNYKFRVHESVKGDFGDTVRVSSGELCGLELRVGRKTGLFLDGSHEAGWDAGMCDTISPRELREAARPLPEPDGSGPIELIAGGNWGDMGLFALDSQGRTLAYGRRLGGSSVADVCPDSTRFLESPWRKKPRFVVRDTSTFDILDVVYLPEKTSPWPTWCMNEDGSDILFGDIDYGEPLSKSRLLRYRNGAFETVYEGTSSGFEPVGDKLFLTEGRYGRRIMVLDLTTGEKTFVARAPRYVQGVAISPDGTRLATTAGADREKLVSVDMSVSPAVLRVKDHGIGRDGETYWLDDDTIVYLPGGYDNSKVKLFDAELNLKSRLAGSWYTLDEELVGNTAYGAGWGIVYRAVLPDGPAEVLRKFPSPEIYTIGVVTDEIYAEPNP